MRIAKTCPEKIAYSHRRTKNRTLPYDYLKKSKIA